MAARRDFNRTDRIADVIRKELSVIILREIKDPRVGMMTISEVKVSKDLAHAKIYVSTISEEEANDTVIALNKAAGFLRGLLAKRITIRVMPILFFVYDETTLKADRISKLIDAARAHDKGTSKEENKDPE